jgi:hypothetical protein
MHTKISYLIKNLFYNKLLDSPSVKSDTFCNKYDYDINTFIRLNYGLNLLYNYEFYRDSDPSRTLYSYLYDDYNIQPEDSDEDYLLKGIPEEELRSSVIEHSYDCEPIIFWNNNTYEKINENGSYYNKGEAKKVAYLLYILLYFKVNPKNIGVITPYKAQIETIKKEMDELLREFSLNNPVDAIELSMNFTILKDGNINTVDSFQGGEKDYIIFSCVRNNKDHKIGFLSDEKRLNVSLSRSILGLFIIGNYNTLYKSGNIYWRNLIEILYEKGLIYLTEENAFSFPSKNEINYLIELNEKSGGAYTLC